MARGYQGDKGNVKALAMKKWFNTNYHYIVPEIDDDSGITFSDGLYRIHAVVLAEQVNTTSLKTGILLEGALVYQTA